MSRKPEGKLCNKLCAKCLRHCKQDESILLIDCPRFLPFPFKIEKNSYKQMDLFGPEGEESD
jgi:hypothetical protein